MITVADLRAHIVDVPAADDPLLEAYERAAVDFCERFTGRYFGPAVARTEWIINPAGRLVVWLAAEASAVTVTRDGDTVPATEYEVRGRQLVHETGWGWRELRIDYTGGYAAGAEPPAVRQAVKMTVAHWYANREPVVVGTTAADVPLTVTALLWPFRRIVV